jgi:hypothetical protein
MTSLNLGSGGTASASATELSKLAIWILERASNFQPKLRFLLPYEQVDPTSGQSIIVNRSTAWLQKGVVFTRDYGVRYRAVWAIPLEANWSSSGLKLWENTSLNLIDSNSPNGSTNAYTPGTGGDIPATCTTLPKLLIWLGEVSRRLLSQDWIVEEENTNPVPTASASLIESQSHGDMMMYRFSIPLNSQAFSTSQELYLSALMASTVNLPSDLKS